MKTTTAWLDASFAAIVIFSGTAFAGTPYTSRSLWQAAAGPSVTENFSTAPLKATANSSWVTPNAG